MTTQPPNPEELPRPVERPRSQPAEMAPKRERYALRSGFALLLVTVVAVLVAGFVKWRDSDTFPTRTARHAHPSRSTAPPTPRLEPAGESAPPSRPIGTSAEAYVKTPWGTRCRVSTNEIVCDTCEPGLLLDTPIGAAECPGTSLNEVVVNASGTSTPPPTGVILPATPNIQQLAEGQTYHLNGWTIAVSGWVRFTNDATGHGVAVAAQNMDHF
jgi:hypothetical protein